MALYFSSACFSGLSPRKSQAAPVRAMASESSVAVRIGEEEKVKLGGSELKVTKLGIGAWSWGDTSYWNNFEWDGERAGGNKLFWIEEEEDNGKTLSPPPSWWK